MLEFLFIVELLCLEVMISFNKRLPHLKDIYATALTIPYKQQPLGPWAEYTAKGQQG